MFKGESPAESPTNVVFESSDTENEYTTFSLVFFYFLVCQIEQNAKLTFWRKAENIRCVKMFLKPGCKSANCVFECRQKLKETPPGGTC